MVPDVVFFLFRSSAEGGGNVRTALVTTLFVVGSFFVNSMVEGTGSPQMLHRAREF